MKSFYVLYNRNQIDPNEHGKMTNFTFNLYTTDNLHIYSHFSVLICLMDVGQQVACDQV